MGAILVRGTAVRRDCDTKFTSGQPIRKHTPNDLFINDEVEYSISVANRPEYENTSYHRELSHKALQYRALKARTVTAVGSLTSDTPPRRFE
jgi:hypothetical protein